MIEKSDSSRLTLAMIAILGQPPRLLYGVATNQKMKRMLALVVDERTQNITHIYFEIA